MRVLFVRLSSFGDVVFAMPAARAIRTTPPDVTLAWAIEGALAPLVKGASYVDAVFTASTRLWRRTPLAKSTRDEVAALLRDVRAFAPDVVVDAQGLFKSAWLTALAPSPRKVGFGPRTATERVNCLVTNEKVEAFDRPHVADRALALAEHVTGVRSLPRLPDVSHLSSRPSPEVDAWLAARDDRPFALVQPFASRREKEWSEAALLGLADRLRGKGLDVVVRWGPAERKRADDFVARSGGRLLLSPPTAPDSTARLAARAALVVGVDTGPTHLAAATGVPTVALFGPTDPATFGPLGENAVALRAYNSEGGGALPISAEDVYEAARPFLR